MNKIKMALATAVISMSAASSVTAQPNQSVSDLAYCRALSDQYVRYIGHDEDWGRWNLLRSPLDGQVAVAQCRQGNAAAAIPVLEQKLLTQKFTLPYRG